MPPRPTPFDTAAKLRAWLARHHAQASELHVRCYKVEAADGGVTYRQALDEALCFGWIDGVRRKHDGASFSVRFTPRKPKSKWSAVNVARARELEAEGRMQPPGLAAFRARTSHSGPDYSYESEPAELAPAYLRRLRANARAWDFFQAQAPWYRRKSQFWVMSAKQTATRERRLAVMIDCWSRGETIPVLPKKK